jgi:hypothetical protein
MRMAPSSNLLGSETGFGSVQLNEKSNRSVILYPVSFTKDAPSYADLTGNNKFFHASPAGILKLEAKAAPSA